ncbi:MAG: helix-turn-helix domain-containing protein [Fimbriimonadaceae bacterium]|nr:helix-turn-helix domain-containing protein [Fimbriimonadaceae bacterium]
MSGYLTVRETAEVLNMHFMSVYKLVQSGELPALKIGSRWKIDPGQLDDWIARRRGIQREWLLVGGGERLLAAVEHSVGPAAAVHQVPFGAVGVALSDSPDVVLIDATGDGHAALAALDVCRSQEPPPLAVLLVDQPSPALVDAALAHGLTTLMPAPACEQWVAQVEAVLSD